MSPAAGPLPVGFGVVLDEDSRELKPGMWFGGQPARIVSFTASGTAAWAELRSGRVRTPAGGALARRLTDTGLAHPVPPPADRSGADVTVIVPVRDRPVELERCLAALEGAFPVVVVDDASRDPAAVAAVARRHRARVIALASNGGPGRARNAGLRATQSEFVAFLDSDTEAAPGVITGLLGHLDDPAVAAVAPRIVAWDNGRTDVAARYARTRSSLDLGARPARVVPYTRVSYVPTAALLARRSALMAVACGGDVFDPALRVGEDVDLVWRLAAAGWRVRYDPGGRVAHREPPTMAQVLRRRASYGTSAGGLARRHPHHVAPLLVQPWFGAAVAALLAGRPAVAAAAYAGAAGTLAHRLRRRDVPLHGLFPAITRGVQQTWLGTGRYATQLGAPVLLAALVFGGPRTRLAAASLLLGPAVADWQGEARDLDPARFVAAHVADDVAYGLGVYLGCLRARTARPLLPRRPGSLPSPG